jgi:hypothetical protein
MPNKETNDENRENQELIKSRKANQEKKNTGNTGSREQTRIKGKKNRTGSESNRQ